MNGNCSVNDFWGDSLLVDHGLDSLMNVMVDMFAFDVCVRTPFCVRARLLAVPQVAQPIGL
jgi:hypothetical protein